jgi:hypothetical protein
VSRLGRPKCEASKGQAQSPNSKEHATLFLAQNNPSNLMAKILSMIDYLMKRNRRPLDHSLGFHSHPTQPSFESPSPSSKSNYFKMWRPLDFGHKCEDSRGRTLGFLQFDWWKSTASRPSAIVWTGPKGHFTHEPRAMTMKLWEPKRMCPKAVPKHLQNHVVSSQTLKYCSVKSYVTGPLTKCFFNECLLTRVLTLDKMK